MWISVTVCPHQTKEYGQEVKGSGEAESKFSEVDAPENTQQDAGGM